MFQKFFGLQGVPPAYRANFLHLYLDIGWFAVLSGSSINFQSIYAARLGANTFQIGLMSAIPALVSLLLAIPAGAWLTRRRVDKAVFWTAVLYRLGFLFWAFLPWLFQAQGQIWALTGIILLQAIPLTALSVGFNALFASAVPEEFRAPVAGTRNIVLSVAFMATSLFTGWLLNRMPFPLGYQIVFLIGFFGAAMSSLHLYFIRPLEAPPAPAAAVSRSGWLRLDIWRTPFRRTLLALLFFHFSQYLAIPLFPIAFVKQLRLSDENIGIGTALFYLTVLIGSTQLPRLVRFLSHKGVTGWGIVGMSLYPLLLAPASQVWQYYGISVLGGLVWALVGGAYANYLLENCPADDRPAHLAWYNLILNACILSGALIGSGLSENLGLAAALLIAAGLRAVAGLTLLRWG